jgi:hypothetical protein
MPALTFVLLSTTMLIAAAVYMPFSMTAFAQAGSTGGTLGNTDKSISGEREQPREAPRHSTRERPKRASAPLSVSGNWVWSAKCDDGTTWAGTFDFVQSADGAVSGSAAGNDGSASFSGQVQGNTIIGRRTYSMHSNSVVFTFSGGALHGVEPSATHGTCRYDARRS